MLKKLNLNKIILILILFVIFRIIIDVVLKNVEGFDIEKIQSVLENTERDKKEEEEDDSDMSWDDIMKKMKSKQLDDEDDGCCPDTSYDNKKYEMPAGCYNHEDSITCMWRLRKGNDPIIIKGSGEFKGQNTTIYGSNRMLGSAMNSLTESSYEIESGWLNGNLKDISANMLDLDHFWKLYKPDITLKCDSGMGSGVERPGKPTIKGDNVYIKECINKDITMSNQYEMKTLSEMNCENFNMGCYYTLFRGNQGGLTNANSNECDDDGVCPGDWWKENGYAAKRVLLYNLKGYLDFNQGWDEDILATITDDIFNKGVVFSNINEIEKMNVASEKLFLSELIGKWCKDCDGTDFVELNEVFYDKLSVESDSDGYKRGALDNGPIYIWKKVKDYHLFDYNPKIEAIIETIDKEYLGEMDRMKLVGKLNHVLLGI